MYRNSASSPWMRQDAAPQWLLDERSALSEQSREVQAKLKALPAEVRIFIVRKSSQPIQPTTLQFSAALLTSSAFVGLLNVLSFAHHPGLEQVKKENKRVYEKSLQQCTGMFQSFQVLYARGNIHC